MSYSVLLVDDEPIILSGIKNMIKWREYDFSEPLTARNGSEALKIIDSEHPDLIISDIKMPLMDGLELLEITREKHPEIVFIILSSFEEFKLAKEAIKFNALDYLLKTEIDEESLKKELERAKKEIEKRRSHYIYSPLKSKMQQIKEGMLLFMINRSADDNLLCTLENDGFLDRYTIISLLFSFPESTEEKTYTLEDYDLFHEWQSDIAQKVLPSYFDRYFQIINPDARKNSFTYLISINDEATYTAVLSRFTDKIKSASKIVTNLDITVKSTAVHHTRKEMLDARLEIERSADLFYLKKDSADFSDLEVAHLFSRLEIDISHSDTESVKMIFSVMKGRISSIDHRKSSAAMMLSALENAIEAGFSKTKYDYSCIMEILKADRYLAFRDDVVALLESVEKEIENILLPQENRNETIVRAQQYIIDNISRPISLDEVAKNAFISPSYLSSLFKKVTKVSLVDYINIMKVKRAKALMNEGERKIFSIAESLGYENIYYFSKVFKKVTGETPSQYLKKLDNM